MKKRSINFKAVIAAVAAGGGYELAIQGAAKRVDFINENYLVTKSLTAALIGSGMLYFGKAGDETSKAAGYALLGVGGASGAGKISSLIVTSGREPMNGTRAQMIARAMTRKRPDISRVKAMLRGGNRGAQGGRGMSSEGFVSRRPVAPQNKMMQPNAGGDHWKSIVPALSNMSYLYC